MSAIQTPEPVDISGLFCRKCAGQNLGRNGAQLRNGKRFQRLLCRNCKYIWVEYSLPMPDIARIKPDAIASSPKTTNPMILNPVMNPASAETIKERSPAHRPLAEINVTKTDLVQGEVSRASKAIREEQSVKTQLTEERLRSTNAGQESLDTPMFSALNASPSLPFRRLELEVPTDWSPTGVLAYTQHAQQALQQALAQFEHPAIAEVELQRLEPRVREYVRARQAFDTALMLQWAAVFTGSTSHPSLLYGTHLEHSQIRPREASSGARGSSASSLSGRDQLSNDDPDDPEHSVQAELLRQLEAFKRQEKTWRTDRLMLKQELQLLELDKQRVVTNWTRVKQHYEGLKTRLRNGEATGQGISLNALPAVSESTRRALPQPPAREFAKTMTTSLRIAPPALSASEQAKIERLSSSLIANLIRLEGYRVRPRDIVHVAGERGPWKTVLEHLLNLGQIERVGDFISLSLVERLRRHLPATNLETTTGRRKP